MAGKSLNTRAIQAHGYEFRLRCDIPLPEDKSPLSYDTLFLFSTEANEIFVLEHTFPYGDNIKTCIPGYFRDKFRLNLWYFRK